MVRAKGLPFLGLKCLTFKALVAERSYFSYPKLLKMITYFYLRFPHSILLKAITQLCRFLRKVT